MNPPPLQQSNILTSGGVRPHLDVHRGRNNHRRRGGNVERGKEIVGDAVREFGQRVRSCRRDEEKIDGLSQLDMLDLRVISRPEHLCDHWKT
jgi:hypothetical protein